MKIPLIILKGILNIIWEISTLLPLARLTDPTGTLGAYAGFRTELI